MCEQRSFYNNKKMNDNLIFQVVFKTYKAFVYTQMEMTLQKLYTRVILKVGIAHVTDL